MNREKKSEIIRQSILTAAADLFEQNGFENTITNNSSALSDHQAERLASITNNAVILYDQDDYGIRLAMKDASKLDTFGIYVTYGV